MFPPILEALKGEFPSTDDKRVLVPGCGLGRLAYEIATQGTSSSAISLRLSLTHSLQPGFETIGNDFSHFMHLGTSLIFSRTITKEQHQLSPYIHSFSHQRSSEDLLRTVSFPDVLPGKDVKLKFEQGDFLSAYKDRESFDAIVTLFFIDTVSTRSLSPVL